MKVGEIWKSINKGDRVKIVKITYHPPCDIVPYSWDSVDYEWVDVVFWHSCSSEQFLLCFERDYESR